MSIKGFYRTFIETGRYFQLFMIAGIVLSLGFGLIDLNLLHRSARGILFLLSSPLFFFIMVYYHLSKNIQKSTRFVLGILIVLFSTILFIGGNSYTALLWTFIIPLVAFYTQGKVIGIITSLLFLAEIFILAGCSYLGVLSLPFSAGSYFISGIVFLLVTTMTYLYSMDSVYKESQILYQLNNNALTGLPNRKKLFEDISSLEDRLLILINIDEFKEINDFYGIEIGDKVLIEIANGLRRLMPQYSGLEVYKLHADEFALLFKRDPPSAELEAILQDISQSVLGDISVDGVGIALSASIGVSNSKRDLLADTDIALKLSKEKKRPFVIFDPSMKISETYESNQSLLRKLRQALVSDGITPYFQPILCNQTGKVLKYECLLRIIDHDTLLMPNEILSIAKRAKLYPLITRTMIRKCFEQFRDRDESFSINICIDDILNKETLSQTYEMLSEYPAPERVIFELLETEELDDNPAVSEFITNIKKRGSKIALDDFGSGYSNFEYILRMKADYIKIDSSLVRNLDTNQNAQIVTETIVSFTKRLGIQTIAEYVHNPAVQNKVRSLGIDFSQGYEIGKPTPRLQLKRFL